MSGSGSLNEDAELAALRARCYRGIVKAPLDKLDFDHPLVLGKRREISEQNVRRLERIFQRNGCLRLQEENVINAVVLDDDLPALLSSTALTPEQLCRVAWARDAPALSSGKLKCLSGLHRIQAAKRHLDENDKWWPVRLFSADIPKPYLTRIVESFVNEQKPSDGEIFRKIRLYHRQNDVNAENRWWACLDKSKLRDLRQLLKKKEMTTAFDSLLDLPGLWTKIQLGALQRLLALKCDEEMITYLRHIKRAWNGILRTEGGTLPYSMVDTATVERLQLLAPNHSKTDRDLVSAMMRTGVLFPAQHDETIRQSLEINICSYNGIIPSLWTFFETLKYLEPICEVLRKLLGGKVRRTIRASLQGYYFPPEKTVVQVSETRDVELTAELSKEEAAHVSYVELWTFCARHFDELTTFTPRMEHKGAKPLVRGPNPVVWQCFAKFAISRGFITPRAKELSESSCASQLALDYLRKANPLSINFNATLVEKIVAISSSHASKDDDEDFEQDDSFIRVERRCGRPYELDLARDKRTLFFRQLYVETESNTISLNLVRRDLFSCIFGSSDFQPTDLSSVPRSYRSDHADDVMDVDGHSEDACTSNETIYRLYTTLQQDYKAQDQAMQIALTAKADLSQLATTAREECERFQIENSTLQAKLEECEQLHVTRSVLQAKLEECEQLHAMNSALQAKLEEGLKSSNQNLQARVEKIVELEHGNKKYRDMAVKATASCEAATDQLREAESREKVALEEGRRYKQLASDLQEQIDRQVLSTPELPLSQQIHTGTLAISTASARNPDEIANMIADVDSHSTWVGSNTSHILFVAIANASNGRPKGFECEISHDREEASHTIESILAATKHRFDSLTSWNTLGKTVLTSSIAYVFEVLSLGTVFLGPDVVFQRFLYSHANEIMVRPIRKIKQVKRVRDPNAHRDDPTNFKEIPRYESSSENEVYESAADDDSYDRARKVPPNPVRDVGSSRPLEDPFEATTRPGDPSDSESDRMDEDTTFRHKRILF